ncbi:MAG: hypothetical protein COT85_03015 [Chlamydiae bacterium CG10_big_fil_rev_8_21_14_0_10_42_34]|nr:MAG: hypothetical protein COT85_03015 [Chlamydiae bacterium CG10_big_fil_rev_8_21_14_0_10_42_34]
MISRYSINKKSFDKYRNVRSIPFEDKVLQSSPQSRFWLLAFISVLAVSSLSAKPAGMQVISGNASDIFENGKNSWIIQSGDKTILHWDQFSIGEGEKIIFQQLGANSAVLNRIMGSHQVSF